MNFSDKTSNLSATKTKALKPVLADLLSQGIKVIDLGHGEAEINLAESTVDLVCEELTKGNIVYSDSSGSIFLRDKIALAYEISPNQVSIGLGVKQLCQMSLDLLCDKDDDVIVITPNWFTYEQQILFGEYKYCPFCMEQDFSLNVVKLEEYITRLNSPKVIIISNPNNPTGKVFSRNELESIYNICIKYNLTLISDEVFSDMCFGDKEFVSIAEIAKSISPDNYVVINSASKNYGMSGLRVGYVISNIDFIKKVNLFNTISINNVPDVLQLAFLNELNQDVKHRADIKNIKAQYNFAVDCINNSKNMKLLVTGGTSTIFPKITNSLPISTSEFALRLLKEKHVLVIPGDIYGFDSFLRLSYVGEPNLVKEGISLIDSFITEVLNGK